MVLLLLLLLQLFRWIVDIFSKYTEDIKFKLLGTTKMEIPDIILTWPNGVPIIENSQLHGDYKIYENLSNKEMEWKFV